MKNENNKLFSRGTKVQTPDGAGTAISINMRKNTNGGPGARQYVVELDDGKNTPLFYKRGNKIT
jgi:hypothetical protein